MFEKKKYLVWLALIFYFLIILQGDMIGIPLVIWLLYSLSQFGKISQLFAIVAIVGSILFTLTHSNYKPTATLFIRLLAICMMLSPILWKLSVLPFHLFNYSSFVTPILLFMAISVFLILSDLATIYRSKDTNTNQKY